MKTFLLIAVVAVAGLTWWFIDRGGIYRTEHRAYRFEVTVDTPEGLKTAYSVHEITIQDQTWTPARTNQIKLVGEAVPFALQDGRILFATLISLNTDGFTQVLGPAVEDGLWINIREHFDFQLDEKVWPRLAIIDAVDRPETLRMADGRKRQATYLPAQKLVYETDDSPSARADADQFRVIGARIVSTDEKMTSKVADVLPWLMETIERAPYSARQTTDLQLMAFILKTGVRG